MKHSNLMARSIHAEHARRGPASTETWDYRAYSTWRDEIWKLLRPIVNDRVKAAFKRNPPEYVVCDDLSWLDEIILSVRKNEVSSKEFLCEQLCRRYKAIRAVHGTRTADLSPFYSEGLLPLDPAAAHERARQIFLGGGFPEVTQEMLDRAIESVGSNLRRGRVYFEANEEMLIDHCGHYMLYGSEYLIAIAAHLRGSRDYRQVLKTFGQPTLFLCDVPLRLIPSDTLEEFAGNALEMVFQELLVGADFEPDPYRGAGFCIHERLPAECIVGHYHPIVRRDPYILGH